MIGGFSTVSQNLASIYRTTNSTLADTLGRIASGKRVAKPSDDFVGYAKAQALQTSIDNYRTVKEGLTELKGVSDMAVELGNGISEDLTRMKELATLYSASTDDSDKAAYNAEFKALASSIADTISNSKHGNVAVVSAATIDSVEINPDNTNDKISITYAATDITAIATAAEATNWFLGGGGKSATNVQTEIDKAVSYLVKSEGFSTRIDRQISITDTITNSKNAAKSIITDIDEVEEITKATDLQIRQQAAIAMIAQANVGREGILQLYL